MFLYNIKRSTCSSTFQTIEKSIIYIYLLIFWMNKCKIKNWEKTEKVPCLTCLAFGADAAAALLSASGLSTIILTLVSGVALVEAEGVFLGLLYWATITPYRPCLLAAGWAFFFLDRVVGLFFFVIVPSGHRILSGSISNLVPPWDKRSASSAAIISMIRICFHKAILFLFNSTNRAVNSSHKSSLWMLKRIAPREKNNFSCSIGSYRFQQEKAKNSFHIYLPSTVLNSKSKGIFLGCVLTISIISTILPFSCASLYLYLRYCW